MWGGRGLVGGAGCAPRAPPATTSESRLAARPLLLQPFPEHATRRPPARIPPPPAARRLSGGWLGSATKLVRSSSQSYDKKLAAELWDASAEFAGLPKAPQI